MRFTKTLAAAGLCLSAAEGLKFQMHLQPFEAVQELTKRATTISTNFKFAAPRFAFYVDVLIGSAHEFLRLRLASDPFTWFPGPLPRRNYCNNDDNDRYDFCYQYNFSGSFNPDGSDTFKNLTSVMNLTGSDASSYTVGYYGQDTIQIGQTEIDNVPIGIARDYTRIPQLGLGIGGSGSLHDSLLRTMLREDVISVLAYGLYLNDYDTNSSELTIGAIDTAKYEGNLITFESSETTTVQLASLEYDTGSGDPEVLGSGWNANVEFSTGSIYLKNGPLEAIVKDVDAYLDRTYGAYLLDCAHRYGDKVLRFNFEGMTINVPASQWIVPAFTRSGRIAKLEDGKTPGCTLLVDLIDGYGIAVENGYSAILGMPFVRATYMVHDFTNQQTSFAQAKLNTSDSEVRSLNTDGVAPFASMVPSTTASPSAISPTGTDVGRTTGGPGDNGGDTSSEGNNNSGGNRGGSTPVGAIVGGVVGGVAVIGLAIGAFFILRRRQKKKTEPEELPRPPVQEHMAPPPVPPQPYDGYGGQQQTYGQQGYHNEQYGQAPLFPNKGVDQLGNSGTLSPRPVSEIAGSPVGSQDQRYSSIAPSGISELPSPRQEQPIELPGHR